MPSDSGETRRTATRPHGGAGVAPPPPAEQEQLPCPRCDSANTKFCYYNNYNFSQPRHFCKSCRRYWTHGGTLRDIPVGGGSRKSAKRSRTCSAPAVTVAAAAANAVVSSSARNRNIPFPATPILFPSSAASAGGNHAAAVQFGGETKGSALSLCGSFTSLLNSSTATSNGLGGLLGLGGFGLGLGPGPGLDDVSFGLGRAVWPFSTIGDGTACVGSNGGPAAPMPATWQLEGLETNPGFVAGDCFAWPDLAISTRGSTLK